LNFKKNRITKLKVINKLFVLGFVLSINQQCSHVNKPNLPDPLEAGWKGEKVCEILEENNKLRVLKCSFPPLVGHEKHFHPVHHGYTLKGSKFRITDTTGTKEVDVPTGYSWFKDDLAWHEVQNIGSDTAVFLIIEPK